MTDRQIENLCKSGIEVSEKEHNGISGVAFRDPALAWYQADPNRCTFFTPEKLEQLTPEDVLTSIRRGLMVDGITRITGYMTKVSSWNPGKRAELRDRRKHAI